jgi:hypothetical protein
MIDLKSFLNKDSFAAAIEKKVLEGSTYFEAVIEFADECNKSPEEMLPFMTGTVILDKVRKSATDSGLIDSEIQVDLFE